MIRFRVLHRPSMAGSVSIVVVAAFLPFLFFLFSLSIDIAAYYTAQSKAQAALDEVTQYAFRFLPDVSGARNAAATYAQRFTALADAQFEVDDSVVIGRIERSSPLLFARLVGLRDVALPLRVISRARGTPVDAMLIVDSSAAVAPALNGSSTDAWGSDIHWPAAQALDSVPGLDLRLQTQQCFNPTFSAIKSAAQLAYQILGASKVNSVGLGFYTGIAGNSLSTARTVSQLPTLPARIQPEVVPFGSSAPYVGPTICTRIAEQEINALHYRFPQRASTLPDRGDLSSRPLSRLAPGGATFDTAYGPYFTGEELIWMQPSAGASALSAPRFFGEAFAQALGALLSGERSQQRGGLSALSEKLLVFVMSHLPQESSIAWSGASMPQDLRARVAQVYAGAGVAQAVNQGGGSLTILFAIIESHNLAGAISGEQLAALASSFEQLGEQSGIAPDALSVRAFRFRSDEQLALEFSRLLAALNRTTVVAL